MEKKKFLSTTLPVIILLLLVANVQAFAAKLVNVTSVTLNKTTTTLIAGTTETLTAKVAPSNAANKSVIWSSSNTNVVKVDQQGVVIAVAAGNAIITVKTTDGSKTAVCTVTVKRKTTKLYIAAPQTNLYKTASFDSDILATIPSQNVSVIQQNGDWYLIESLLGDVWINIKKPIATLNLTAPGTNLYKTASFDSAILATIPQQTVTIVQKKGDWYCIKSYAGDAWFTLKTPPQYPALTAQFTNLYKTNSFDSQIIGGLGPQIVIPIEKNGDWYCIDSYVGKAWFNIKAPIGIVKLTAQPTNLYKTNSFDSQIIGGLGPQSVTPIEKNGDWYCINSYVGKAWFTLKTPPINDRINRLLNVTRAEIGTTGTGSNGNNTKYGIWYGYNNVAWSSIFVSWVGDHSGNASIIPRTASCSEGVNWFKMRGLFGNTPRVGAIVYFGQNGVSHVGIVESVNKDGTITTIEGNYDSKVTRVKRQLNNYIYGYGYPQY